MLAVDYMTHRGASPPQKYSSRPPSTASETRRTRTIRLVRPAPNGPSRPPPLGCRHGPGLGFSVRGGREHGTGVFVSHVEPGSEAHAQGLRVGDQIVRINGFTLEDAVHKEVLQLISNHTHITLKVRSVGMIPVKDKKTDTLSWQIISDSNYSSRSSPQLDKIHDVRINIMVAPRSKLGCGICKGPEWKPGIFVQFTKEGGIAREAGLRPGDQILYCNNVDFSDILFNEAVNLMKTSRQLDLIVRKAAGSELFPGESSGYNSSASSVTGDQSPSWSDSKRLSIVKEENLDLEDRLSHLERYKMNVKKWETIEWEEEPEEKPYFKSTIKINGPETQAMETNTKNTPSNKLTDICLVSQQHETKTVIVEVHRSDIEEKKKNESNELAKSPSTSSFGSLASKSSGASVASSSLCSAITQEIQRRFQKKHVVENDKPSIDEQLQMKKILKGVSSDQQYQHTKLMDEFKRAHQKMFKSPNGSKEDSNNSPGRPNVTTPSKEAQDRLASQELSQKLSERLTNLQTEESQNERLQPLQKQNSLGTPPPPPPPPPLQNGTSTPPAACSTPTTRSNTLKSKPKAPPVPVKYSVLSYNQPPPCPTPDYDTLSIASTTSSIRPNHLNDSVEVESLDSYKINNPTGVKPRPPSIYFQRSPLSSQTSNGSDSGTIRKRPVSVTISEYPSSTLRRQPGRLNFLQNGVDEPDGRKSHSITSQFASELTQTLNRSNLRKRTESMEDLLDSHIKSNKNGSVRISLNSSLCKNLAKSTSDLTEDFSENYSSRVTINVNQKGETPSGILKNSNFFSQNGHKALVQQKSITFGETPIVIKDRHIT